MRERDVLKTIELLYAAAVDTTKWGEALSSISDLLCGFDATLEVHTTQHAIPLYFLNGNRIPADGSSDYLSHYCNVCSRLNEYERYNKAGHVGFDHDFITEAEIDHDEFYTDFLARHDDLRYYISATLADDDQSYVGLFVHRTRAQGHVGEKEISLMRRIMPHAASAFDIHLRLERDDQQRAGLEAALDGLDFGALLLDKAGRIVFANATAFDIFMKNDGLSTSDNNRLIIGNGEARRAFDAMLQRLLGGVFETSWAWGGDVCAPRSSNNYSYNISVRRLPASREDAYNSQHGAVLVFIADPLRPAKLAKDVLRRSFGLTKAEIDVVCAFAELASASDVAALRQVSVATVRSQLKHAMHKLDVRNQTDLVRFLLSMRAPLS